MKFLPFHGQTLIPNETKLQMLFSQNQCINIMYPNENYPFVVAPHGRKLDSIHERSSSNFFHETEWDEGYKCFFHETNASISCIPMRTTICLSHEKKKLDSIHRRISSRFKNKLWIQTKRRLQMLFSQKQRNNIMYPNENYPSAFVPIEKKIDSIHEQSLSRFKGKLWFQTNRSLQRVFS